ncbi:MAG TPA: FimV/HubP family polar landmark protein, partial [Xanthomonadales bacterium]|nr:FimV/HubP family polar landmark protein [Xanthomonadales bacterium]
MQDKHLLRIVVCLGLLLFSQPLMALGLGNAEVRSYLNQPLEARIQLLNTVPEELESMTAGLATAADFERLGLTRTVSVPLHFRVNTGPDQAYVEVTSRLPVSDPVVQLVLEVRWTGGRMLREYTLFLDPPTVAARAPAPMVSKRRPAEAPVRPEPDYPDPAQADFVETVKTPVAPARPESVPDLAGPEERPVETEPEASVEAEPATPVAEDEAPALAEVEEPAPVTPAAQDEVAAPAEVEQAASPAAAVAPAALPPGTGQEYGPVQRGDTLWRIASNYARGTSYTINQAMLAIQRMNPDAFGGNNINVLHRGAILRMPPLHELDRLSENEARAEAIRQEQAYRTTRSGPPSDVAPPMIADAALESISGESRPISAPTSIAAADEARLELVPPAAGS